MRPYLLPACIALILATRVEAQGKPDALLRQLYGDLAIEVRSAGGGGIYVGAADSSKSIAVILRAADVRKWADSATRVRNARLRGKEVSGRWQATVEEPGVRSGSMMISRTIDGPDSVIAIVLADDSLASVRKVMDIDDAEAFVGAMKRVATRVVAQQKPVAKPPVKAPAKPPAKPPMGIKIGMSSLVRRW